MPDKNFNEFIKEVETDPVFKRYVFADKKEEKLIRMKSYPKINWSGSFSNLDENIISSHPVFDAESYVEKWKTAVSLIKRIGIEQFKKYFLYADSELPLQEISKHLKLTVNELHMLIDFVNAFEASTEYAHTGSILNMLSMHFTRVALINYSKDIHASKDEFEISFLSSPMGRDAYLIDYEKAAQLKRSNTLSRQEIGKLNELLKKLELINMRKYILYQIIKTIAEKQKRYLISGLALDLVVFTKKDLAKAIGTHPSTISRVLYGKSIVLPWGEEKPLEFFCVNNKRVCENAVRELLAFYNPLGSDSKIKELLKEQYHLDPSRRSIALYRKNVKIF
jgi:hypothetical protein